MIPSSDMDYVEFYARKLRTDNSIFRQQKMLIESQLKSSAQTFSGMFGKGPLFKRKAREYLKKTGRI